MQEIESRAEDLVLDIEQKLGTRDAEAQSRQAPIWASISGQYKSTQGLQYTYHCDQGPRL